jgi:hypothetical protein
LDRERLSHDATTSTADMASPLHLFEQHSREGRARVMRLFAESTFDVESTLKDWLEKSGPVTTGRDRNRRARDVPAMKDHA